MAESTSTLTPEADFAEQLTLDRELVREARKKILTEGVHWHGKTGVPILLTADGVALLLDYFATQKNEAPAKAPPEPIIVVVTRQVPNPRQVLCRRENEPRDATSIVLRVPTTIEDKREVNFFTPGLRVLARHVEGATHDYSGPRPRFRGDHLILAPQPAPNGAV